MKRILIMMCLTLLITSVNAKENHNDKVVNQYLKVSYLLFNGDIEELPDAEKYALKALDWMKKNKMDMNSRQAMNAYASLSIIYHSFASASKYGVSKEASPTRTIKMYKASILYLEKNIEIETKLVRKNPSSSQYVLKLRSDTKALDYAKEDLAEAQKELLKEKK